MKQTTATAALLVSMCLSAGCTSSAILERPATRVQRQVEAMWLDWGSCQFEAVAILPGEERIITPGYSTTSYDVVFVARAHPDTPDSSSGTDEPSTHPPSDPIGHDVHLRSAWPCDDDKVENGQVRIGTPAESISAENGHVRIGATTDSAPLDSSSEIDELVILSPNDASAHDVHRRFCWLFDEVKVERKKDRTKYSIDH